MRRRNAGGPTRSERRVTLVTEQFVPPQIALAIKIETIIAIIPATMQIIFIVFSGISVSTSSVIALIIAFAAGNSA